MSVSSMKSPVSNISRREELKKVYFVKTVMVKSTTGYTQRICFNARAVTSELALKAVP